MVLLLAIYILLLFTIISSGLEKLSACARVPVCIVHAKAL